MEIFDTEECVRFASKVARFEGATLSLCLFGPSLKGVSGRRQKQQRLDLGDKVMECLTGQTRKGLEMHCDVRFRSRKTTPRLDLEYRGKDRTALNEILRFVGKVELVPSHFGTEHPVESSFCQLSDFRFIESQERIVHDDLLLAGEMPSRPPAWPPALRPDQEKPAPTCKKQERAEPSIDAVASCYLRFEFAKGASFELSATRPGPRADCEDATIVAKGREHATREIGAMSSCRSEVPVQDDERGAKTDRWYGRGWVGDVAIKPSGMQHWAAIVRIRLFDHPFPSAVSIQTKPLAREDMRSFLLALSNGGFYPADCATSMVQGACDPCREIQANRERWHNSGQDLLQSFMPTAAESSGPLGLRPRQ